MQIKNEQGNVLKISGQADMVLDGPLSDIYAKQLQELYEKKIDPATNIAIETQELDTFLSKSLFVAAVANSHQEFKNSGQSIGMLYGTTQDKAGVSDIINIGDAISDMTDEQKANSVIIVDTTQKQRNDGTISEVKSDTVNPFESDIRSIAQENNIPVYSSLEDFLVKTIKR